VTTYVALVRGINVGSSTLVPMADFARLLNDAGFTEVKTLLRSGNAVFDAPAPLGEGAVVAIEKRFADVTGVKARFVLLEASDFLGVVRENPLASTADDLSKLMITFLPGPAPDPTGIEFPDADGLLPEVISLGSRAVYAWCPLGVSNSAIPAKFWRQFGPAATTRNANTANKLVSLVLPRLEG
jgi:uncharacterized protein (DUF1697 family)